MRIGAYLIGLLIAGSIAVAASPGDRSEFIEQQWQLVLGKYHDTVEDEMLDVAYEQVRYISAFLEIYEMKHGELPGTVGEFAPWREIVERDLGETEYADKLLRFDRDPWHRSIFYARLSDDYGDYLVVSGGLDQQFDLPYADLIASATEGGTAYCDTGRKTRDADVLYFSGAVCPRGH